MAKRQLKMYAKPQVGNTTTTTISNVNPQADSATMRSFAQQLNAFTNNTYEKTDLVETTNVDTEVVKTVPTLSFPDTIPVSNYTNIEIPIEYNGDGYVTGYYNDNNQSSVSSRIVYNSNTPNKAYATLASSSLPHSCYMQLFATETTNFYAASTERKRVTFVEA